MIELEDVPELIDPVMVAAFEGWNDAGDAASSAVAHLDEAWDGKVFHSLDAEDYYDFQVNRPTVWMEGPVRRITWPTTRLSVVRVTEPRTRDLVLVRGIEPSMRWRTFCNELLGLAHELGVEMVVILGALLGDTPHTRPVPVNGVTSDPELARRLALEESRYEGPTGIVGVLQEACTHAGLPTVTFWAAVPHYVAQPPNPKATLALLNKVEDLLDVRIPLGDLSEDARAWQIGVDQLASEDSEVAEYVHTLEEARDTAELPEASGDAIAREFERYLRRREKQRTERREEGRHREEGSEPRPGRAPRRGESGPPAPGERPENGDRPQAPARDDQDAAERPVRSRGARRAGGRASRAGGPEEGGTETNGRPGAGGEPAPGSEPDSSGKGGGGAASGPDDGGPEQDG